jgi:carboxylesterase type B
MRAAEVNVLLDAMSKYSANQEEKGLGFGFDAKSPSIQSPSLTIPRFLSEEPRDILAKKAQNNIPLIMGAMRHDGTFVFQTLYDSFLVKNDLLNNSTFLRNQMLPWFLEAAKTTDRSGGLAHAVGKTYIGDAYKTGDFWKMLPGMIDVLSVWAFKAPGYELVEQHAKLNPNSYYYSFDHTGFWSTYDLGGTDDIPGGIAHVDDMMYSFQIFPLIPVDRKVSNRFVEYFVNFAKSGDPNGPGGEIKFPAYNSANHNYLSIGKEDKIEYNCRDSWVNTGVEIDYK